MLTYPYRDCPWVVRHKVDGDRHLAWRMRAFMIGDFLNRRPARSDFIINRDGTPADWTKRPRCETCGVVPETDDLIVIERSTGANHFLDVARDAITRRVRREWNETRKNRCRWCQDRKRSINEDRLCRRCQEIADEPAPVERPPQPNYPPTWPPPPVCLTANPPPEE